MPSVREALDKLSEMESRKAIISTVVTYLETHFKSSDAGTPDMTITREDLGVVPESHIDAFITALDHESDQLAQEMEEWNSLSILPPADEEEVIANKIRKSEKKRRTRGTASQRRDPTERE